MKRMLILLLLASATTVSFTSVQVVKYNGCYKSASEDLAANSKYYLRFYSDGSVIEYENPPHIKISFDKTSLARIMKKESTNEKFPLKAGNYFIKEQAIKIVLNAAGETVTYEGTVTKNSLKAQRHSTRTNERQDMEFTFIKIREFR